MEKLGITWYGHSNILLQEGGASVLIDPFFEGNPFAPDWRSIPRPDVIAVTHDHGDHLGQAQEIARQSGAAVACIFELAEELRSQGLDPDHICGMNMGGTVVARGVRLRMTQAFHSAHAGAPAGFIIEMPGGHRVYHAGDTSLFGDMQLLGELYQIDVALLPIGGVFTMDAFDAAQAVRLLGAPAVLPIHYATFPVLAQDAGEFLGYVRKTSPDCEVLTPKPGETVFLSQKRTDRPVAHRAR